MSPMKDAADRFYEGLQLLRAGDYETAIQEFSAAITLYPDHRGAYFRRAEAYRHLGMEEQARADIEKAESLLPAIRQKDENRSCISAIIHGAIVGAIIGGSIGFLGSFLCIYLFLLCLLLFVPLGLIGGGIVGAIVGAIGALFKG